MVFFWRKGTGGPLSGKYQSNTTLPLLSPSPPPTKKGICAHIDYWDRKLCTDMDIDLQLDHGTCTFACLGRYIVKLILRIYHPPPQFFSSLLPFLYFLFPSFFIGGWMPPCHPYMMPPTPLYIVLLCFFNQVNLKRVVQFQRLNWWNWLGESRL